MSGHFTPGDWIVLREVWDGRTWELRRGIIVRDDAAAVVVYTPAATPALVAGGPGEARLRIPPAEWTMAETTSPPDRHFLAIHPPGTQHSTLCIWDERWELVCWYVNLESDLEHTAVGFQYEDHFLDVIVEPDHSVWHWKDEDELEETVELGMVVPGDAEEYYAEGRRAVEWLLARRPPYDERWDDWRPPEGWTAEAAPTGWPE